MGPVDWRELYESNRRAIRDAGVRQGHGTQHGETEPPSRASHSRWARLQDHVRRVLGDQGRERFESDTLTRHPRRPGGGTGLWRESVFAGPSGSRPYAVYRPADLRRGAPLVVLLHGCTQNPADLAEGTRIHLLADRHGFAVAYPQQVSDHNQRLCWNWFSMGDQVRGSGEPGIIAGIVREVSSALATDARRVYIAGMSAGGAMAAVLGATYPDVFAAIGVHSGIPFRAATDVRTALTVMRTGGEDPVTRHADAALHTMAGHRRVVPAIVLHGTQDRTVHPVNGDRLVQQWMIVNREASGGDFTPDPARPDHVSRSHAPGGHAVVTSQWADRRGRVLQEYWQVQGMGHAWSGGGPSGSFTDANGPDASAAMWRFFARHTR